VGLPGLCALLDTHHTAKPGPQLKPATPTDSLPTANYTTEHMWARPQNTEETNAKNPKGQAPPPTHSTHVHFDDEVHVCVQREHLVLSALRATVRHRQRDARAQQQHLVVALLAEQVVAARQGGGGVQLEKEVEAARGTEDAL